MDITQRRLLEDQVIRSHRVDALAKQRSRVSLEIHNLLTVVSGYSDELILLISDATASQFDGSGYRRRLYRDILM